MFATMGWLLALSWRKNSLPQSLEKRTFSLYTFSNYSNPFCIGAGLFEPK
jgi:hypothetical protein